MNTKEKLSLESYKEKFKQFVTTLLDDEVVVAANVDSDSSMHTILVRECNKRNYMLFRKEMILMNLL